MGGSMGYQFHTVQSILLCMELLQEQQTIIELDGTRVLLTKQLEVRQDGDTIFLKGTNDAGIAFHPLDSTTSLIENLIELGHLVRIGLTVQCTHLLTVSCSGFLVEVTGNKRIKEGW